MDRSGLQRFRSFAEPDQPILDAAALRDTQGASEEFGWVRIVAINGQYTVGSLLRVVFCADFYLCSTGDFLARSDDCAIRTILGYAEFGK